MNQISLEFLSSRAWLWLLLAPAFLALAVWAYYRTLAPLTRPARSWLRVLRGLAFLIVLFALAEPILTLVLPEPGKPGLAVLVDGSASMALPGAGSGEESGTRAREASAIVRQLTERLGGDFRLDWFHFDSGTTPEEKPPAEKSQGNTALGAALESMTARQATRPVSGVVLVSDGANTVGHDPVGIARTSAVPIFSVRVGHELPPPDARIMRVRVDPVAFVGDPTPMEIEIASSGLPSGGVELRIEDQGRVLASQMVTLPGGDEVEQSVRLDVRPATVGLRRFHVRLVGADDPVPQNNEQSVAVRVLERKTRVLVLEGALDWDHAFLRRALDADSTFAYRFLVCDRNGRWLPERAGGPAPSGPGSLREYAAVVLGTLPDAVSRTLYAELARFVQQGGGLWVLGGRAGASRLRGTPLESLLPAQLTGGGRYDQPEGVKLEAAGLTHPVTSLTDSPTAAERVWGDLPPIWPSADRVRPRADAAVLLTFTGRGGREPAMLSAFAGEGKVLLLDAYGFWRWDFLPRGGAQKTGEAHRDFCLRAVRWLAEPTLRDRFLAEPIRGVFQNGEPPEFRARVWDERYAPIADARVTVQIFQVDSSGVQGPVRELELRPQGLAGNYGGQTEPLEPGTYRLIATAAAADRSGVLGRIESDFWVDTNGPEFQRLRPDPGTMEQVARASGGEATDRAGLGALIEKLPSVVRRMGRVREIELWNHLLLFLSFVTVLCVEWFLRRRRGLA
jgi:hypothetical protein